MRERRGESGCLNGQNDNCIVWVLRESVACVTVCVARDTVLRRKRNAHRKKILVLKYFILQHEKESIIGENSFSSNH